MQELWISLFSFVLEILVDVTKSPTTLIADYLQISGEVPTFGPKSSPQFLPSYCQSLNKPRVRDTLRHRLLTLESPVPKLEGRPYYVSYQKVVVFISFLHLFPFRSHPTPVVPSDRPFTTSKLDLSLRFLSPDLSRELRPFGILGLEPPILPELDSFFNVFRTPSVNISSPETSRKSHSPVVLLVSVLSTEERDLTSKGKT